MENNFKISLVNYFYFLYAKKYKKRKDYISFFFNLTKISLSKLLV